MRAAWYERNGPAAEVITIGEMPTPKPAPGEVLVRLATSGVNPSDWKTRSGRSRPIAWPRVIPHSDGAGTIEAVGEGVPRGRSWPIARPRTMPWRPGDSSATSCWSAEQAPWPRGLSRRGRHAPPPLAWRRAVPGPAPPLG